MDCVDEVNFRGVKRKKLEFDDVLFGRNAGGVRGHDTKRSRHDVVNAESAQACGVAGKPSHRMYSIIQRADLCFPFITHREGVLFRGADVAGRIVEDRQLRRRHLGQVTCDARILAQQL
jgi:hypothetical protein